MSIVERDVRTNDVSLWNGRIIQAIKNGDPLPSWQDISPFGQLYKKIVRFTAIDEDRLLREVVVYSVDDEEQIIPGTEHPIEEPDTLSRSEISDACIIIGSSELKWRPTPH